MAEQHQTIATLSRVDANSPESAADDRPVLMVTGGGLENGGGIGRMVGYVVAAWNNQPRPRMLVVDTRGPKYRRIVWPVFLVGSVLQIARAAPTRPLIHIHLAANTSTLRKLVIAYTARLLGLKFILHLHDPGYAAYYSRQSAWLQGRIRSMFMKAGRVIALGRPAANMIADLLGVPRERIDIVPNAVPGPLTLSRDDSQQEQAEPHILFLGQLQRRKGVHDLIEALARPEVVKLPWRATLAGGGHDQPSFEAQAVAADIRDRIDFPGWLTEKPIRELLRNADILVLPSYAEEMAMSLLEGMAFGLCLVCTPVGAQAEVVEDEVSALVVSPGDTEGLAAALVRCITDPALRSRLGRGARQVYLERYNVADYPEMIAAVYRRV